MAPRIEFDSEGGRIVADEQELLGRVKRHLDVRPERSGGVGLDYDEDLLSLRDQVAEAKPEDVAPLIEQMTRASAIAARRGLGREGEIDAGSPYFAHLRLKETE